LADLSAALPNKRLQQPARLRCYVVASGSRGFAFIVRLPLVWHANASFRGGIGAAAETQSR